jgi:hypothetical protein
MLDYQRIVDDLRSTLYVTGEGVDFLRAAAGEYAAACEEANERLRLCGERLRQGLRSEAIQLCEIEPNLLDVVASLDFPEREQWQAVARRYGIAPPPRLLVEVAAELNEAYALEQPLAALLQQHRLLALARGPLRQRIAVLRQLAEVDSHNRVWQEDLLLLERERVKQLHQEAHEAAETSDLSRLSGLLDELQKGPWLELPPPAILQSMTSACDRLRLQKAIADLERVEIELDAAFSAKDVEAARRLRDSWHAGLAACGGKANPWVVERAGPALAWLAAEDQKQRELAQYEAAVQALEKALDDGVSLVKLEPCYQAAVGHGFSLTPQLAERYQARVAKLELASARRARWVAAGVIATAVLAGVIVVGMVVGKLHARAAQSAALSLNKLLDKKRLWEAQEYFANLEKTSPRVASAVGVQDAAARLRGMLKEEADREAAFAKEIGMVRLSMPDPDPVAWARTRELAKTEEEKRSVLKLDSAIAEHKRRVQEAADRRLDKGLEQVAERIEKLSQDKDADLGKYQSAVTRLRADWHALETGSKEASDAARGRLAAAGSRITSLEMDADRWKKEDAAQRAITEAVGNPARYREELTRYGRECPEPARTAELQRALDEAPLWEGIEQWNDMVRRWQKMDLHAPDSRSMSEVLAIVNSLLQRHGNFPDAEALRARIPYLEALGRRLEAGGPIQAGLRALFADPLMAQVWMVETKDGRRYYLRNQPPAAGAIRRVKYVAGFDFKEIGVPMTDDVIYSGPAPQVALAGAVNGTLANMDGENWESSISSIVQAIYDYKSERALDPILKATLLRKTLELGCQGSSSLERAFGPHLEALKKLNGGQSANWLDPRNASAHTARPQVEAGLAGLPDIAAAAKAACEDCAGLRTCPARLYRWIGWLCRTHQGAWNCATASALRDSGRLCVVRLATPGDRAVIDVIGTVEHGSVTMTPNAAGTMVEGRPVYLDVSENGTKPQGAR